MGNDLGIRSFDTGQLMENLTKILNSRKTQFDRGYYEKMYKEEERERLQRESKKKEEEKTLYLRSEAADILKITIKELELKIKNGEIKHLIQDNVMYISKQEIADYLKSKDNA